LARRARRMKNFLIGVFKFSVVSVVFFFALTIGYGFGANAYLAVSIAGLIFSAVGFFTPLPQLLISNRPTAAALMLLSVMGLATFNTVKERRLTELRATNPHGYLGELRVGEDRELYLRELKTLDPTEYQAELDRQAAEAKQKREVQEAADRAELADLKEKVQQRSSLPLDEQLRIYSRLIALDPQNAEYQGEKQKLQSLRDAEQNRIADAKAAEDKRIEERSGLTRWNPPL